MDQKDDSEFLGDFQDAVEHNDFPDEFKDCEEPDSSNPSSPDLKYD